MRKVVFFIFFIVLIIIAGCIKPIVIQPQSLIKEGVEVKISLLDSYEWSSLSKDILVINLEITNLRNESIWAYPLSKAVIIDSLNRQYSPVREIVYQKIEPFSVSLSFSFGVSSQGSSQGTFQITFGDETQERELLKLIEKYERMKFKDGRIFPGATVSGILLFYISPYRLPGRFILPNVYLEESNKNLNFEFRFER
ncbi:MAG: hypothetical protein ACPLKX_00740 [Dictyoglomaceae bacterium]